jgi:hypothetical protein
MYTGAPKDSLVRTLGELYEYVAKNQNDVLSFLQNLSPLIDMKASFIEEEKVGILCTPGQY